MMAQPLTFGDVLLVEEVCQLKLVGLAPFWTYGC